MKRIFFILCLLAFLFTLSTQTFAVEYMVNLTTDEHDASTADTICDTDLLTVGLQCTLRAAVEQANALPTDDAVTFNNLPANSTITLTTASGGEIPIENNGSLAINGLGANFLTIEGGAGDNRIFFINQATATITGVSLTDGNGTGATFSGHGGAILTLGTLILNSVHITANSATGEGGGVFFYPGGTNHQILNSTFSANTALDCGGVANYVNDTLIENSTISGNTGRIGGGFCIDANTTLRNVTITGNSASNLGGGILQAAGTLTMGNTIVSGNTARISPDIYLNFRTIVTAGYNLIGDNFSVEALFPAGNPNANQDIVGTFTAPINPMLGALALNGGTTPTHALQPNSPAIDKGFSFGSTIDQRGLLRPVDLASYPNATDGFGADIGAYELQTAPTAASVIISGRVTTSNGRGIRNVQIRLVDDTGETRTVITSTFGYYRFVDVPAGQTYSISVSGKKYSFTQSAQVLSLVGDRDDIDFVANN